MGLKVDYTIFEEVWEKEYTLTRQLYRNNLKWPNKAAIIDPYRKKTLTYKQWDEVSNKFSNALLDLGVKEHDVIMGNLFNTYEWFIGWMGSAKAKCIFSSLNFMLPEGQLCKLIDDYEPFVFVYDVELKDTCLKAIELAKKKPKLCVMCGKGEPPEQHVSFKKFIDGKPSESPKTEQDVNWLDPTLGLYNSGTTGFHKGFILNHAMLFFDCMMNAGLLKLDNQCVSLATNPLFHRGGNTTGVIPTLHVGGSVVVMRSFDENLALDYIEKYKVTHMVSAPPIYERMCIAQEKNLRNLSSLRGLASMGAPLDKHSCLKLMEVLCPEVYNGYGTADGHWVTMLRPYELPERAGTIGLAITEDIVRVVKVNLGRRADPNNPDELAPKDGVTEGEIALRTMHCPYGYINRPEDARKSFPVNGWQLPGDTAVWDESGYITIRGRTDDMIISGGENVHPVIVEDVLKEHPGVLDAFVTGAPSKEWGERVIAYVSRKDSSLTVDELEDYCKNHPRLARYQRPRYYKFVSQEELPYNPSGKKMHYVIKERAAKEFPDLP